MYTQWHARKCAGRIYSVVLLSSDSKAGTDVRDAHVKPAKPPHNLGWLCWQNRPGNRQPWLFPALACKRKDIHIKLPLHSDVFYSSIAKHHRNTIQTNLRSERKMEQQLVLSKAPLSKGICTNTFCLAGNVPLEKVPISSLSFLQLSLHCSFVKLPTPVSPQRWCDLFISM